MVDVKKVYMFSHKTIFTSVIPYTTKNSLDIIIPKHPLFLVSGLLFGPRTMIIEKSFIFYETKRFKIVRPDHPNVGLSVNSRLVT